MSRVVPQILDWESFPRRKRGVCIQKENLSTEDLYHKKWLINFITLEVAFLKMRPARNVWSASFYLIVVGGLFSGRNEGFFLYISKSLGLFVFNLLIHDVFSLTTIVWKFNVGWSTTLAPKVRHMVIREWSRPLYYFGSFWNWCFVCSSKFVKCFEVGPSLF